MNVSSEYIRRIYRSRTVLLDLMEQQGYDTKNYSNFSVNNVEAMVGNNQLDMLLERSDGKKASIMYIDKKTQLKSKVIDDYIENLIDIENVIEKKDDIILVYKDEPNENTLNHIKYKFDNEGIYIVVHNIKRLLFNILEHKMVPKSRVLSDIEVEKLKIKYNLRTLKQLPEVSRFDPQSLAMCLRPGQVCEYIRKSPTSIESKYYRLCV
jgi:DNA-directed RNA polymerase subunit H (RpoH/RPB5)